ncbi:NAD(P)/FAD-dependent oxidoreductase [Terriglobus sp.]|uniref:NAD(P)/FAD-dependent oxidoreductase n=1 Tax=Terriglobus sp. TaxID=1889013 RepID=UPI003B00D8C2
MQHPDVVIAGAGVLGLSLALELRRRGRNVLVLDRETPGLASRAAAGMLAAHDPHNPPALRPLAALALELYPAYLDQIRSGSGHPVPIHTEHILEPGPGGHPGHTLLPALATTAGNFILRPEQSLDPRDLHTALRAATRNAGVRFQSTTSDSDTLSFRPKPPQLHRGGALESVLAPKPAFFMSEQEAQEHAQFIDCTGAWSPTHTRPSKGQMLRVQLPPNTLRLPHNGNTTIRTEHIYLVPRLDGSTLIGATVEDAGFDLTPHDTDLDHLRAQAAALLPAAVHAPELERWSGLRPRTPDDLPILGELAPNHYVANGLFRNGILLAPAVARVMAQLLTNEPTTIPLAPFSPDRPAPTLSR